MWVCMRYAPLMLMIRCHSGAAISKPAYSYLTLNSCTAKREGRILTTLTAEHDLRNPFALLGKPMSRPKEKSRKRNRNKTDQRRLPRGRVRRAANPPGLTYISPQKPLAQSSPKILSFLKPTFPSNSETRSRQENPRCLIF